MNPIPPGILGRIQEILGGTMGALHSLSGGSAAETYGFQSGGDSWVVKIDRGHGGNLVAEAGMLSHLRTHSPLPVPEVIAATPDFLLMPRVAGTHHWNRRAEIHAAELLSAMHAMPVPSYGFHDDTLIASLPQSNTPSACWLPFFRDQRLLAMGKQALAAKRLPVPLYAELERVAARLEDYLEEPDHPSLLHGDVWSGNVLARGDRISAFLDPALYWGHREMELAFISLFHSFGDAFFQAYHGNLPIAPEFWTRRRDLYKLYPLLVHVRLFGGAYVEHLAQILKKY